MDRIICVLCFIRVCMIDLLCVFFWLVFLCVQFFVLLFFSFTFQRNGMYFIAIFKMVLQRKNNVFSMCVIDVVVVGFFLL